LASTFDYDDTSVIEPKVIQHSNNLSKDEIPEGFVIRSLKVRIKPTVEQKKIFQRIFGVTRFIYNQAIDFVNHSQKPNFVSLKKMILSKDNNPRAENYPWLFDHTEVPRDAKDMAIHELCCAMASTKESLKARNKKIEFEMKH